MYVSIYKNKKRNLLHLNKLNKICDIYEKEIIEITGKNASGKSYLIKEYIKELKNKYECLLIIDNLTNIIPYQKENINIDILKYEKKLFDILKNTNYDIYFFDSITYYKEEFTKEICNLNKTIFYTTEVRENIKSHILKSTITSQLLQKTNHRIVCKKLNNLQDKTILEFQDIRAIDEQKFKITLKKIL